MTNYKKHGSKKEPIKYIDVCEECYMMEKKVDHIEARGSKFCPKRTLDTSQCMQLLNSLQTNVQLSELRGSNVQSRRSPKTNDALSVCFLQPSNSYH